MSMVSELMAGKAGEHLVCFNLLTQGVEAFLSAQGLPFDVVALHNGKTYKIQVKSCLKPRTDRYIFNIKCGKGGKRTGYAIADVDIVAFVSLATKEVAYLPVSNCKSIIEFMVSANRGKHKSETTREKILNALTFRKENPTLTVREVGLHFDMSPYSISSAMRLIKANPDGWYCSDVGLNYFEDYPFKKAVCES